MKKRKIKMLLITSTMIGLTGIVFGSSLTTSYKVNGWHHYYDDNNDDYTPGYNFSENPISQPNKENHPYTMYHYDYFVFGNEPSSVSTSTFDKSHEHTFVWVDDNENTVTDCTQKTTKHLRCLECGYSFPRGIVSNNETGHFYNESSWVIDKEPTCYSTGVKHQVCRICGKGIRNEGTIIPKLKHEYVKATKDFNGGVKEKATCTHNEICYQKCEKCGAIDKTKFNEVLGTKLPHKFVHGRCVYCGAKTETVWEFLKSWFQF